jgi:hypothetical protein
MRTKRILLVVLAVSIVTLAAGFGPGWPLTVQALPPLAEVDLQNVTVPYAGTLTDPAGQPVPDGFYGFSFALYAVETGGEPLWSEVQNGVAVADGAFEVALGSSAILPAAVLDGGERWLEVGVQGPGEAGFTRLLPRQRLSAALPATPVSATAGLACPHDHVGEVWSANIAWSNGAFKVLNYGNGPSIWGWNGGNGNGIRGYATGTGLGVYGESEGSGGVVGRSSNGNGVEGYSTNSYGILANSTNADSIHVDGAGQYALNIQSSGYAAIYVGSSGGSGVYVNSAGGDGMTIYSATYDGIGVYSAGDDGVHVRPSIGGVCYRCGWGTSDGFVVLDTGEVRSSVGYATPARDFAVMMDVTEEQTVHEPGDVLVASSIGKAMMERSATPYSPAVVGIYSATPGFVGGRSMTDDALAGGVPVAILGVVSCKVSAENGPIYPGDLLVTSSTPGHAMRADRDSAKPGTILGKALESLDSGTGQIQVLLMLQ